jgi:hypothetical protein
MFEIALYFLGVVVVAGLVLAFLQALAKNLWLTFKWNVLRIPPRIYDEQIVKKTVEVCLGIAMENDNAARIMLGREFTEQEREPFRHGLEPFIEGVIEQYIDFFTRRGRGTNRPLAGKENGNGTAGVDCSNGGSGGGRNG